MTRRLVVSHWTQRSGQNRSSRTRTDSYLQGITKESFTAHFPQITLPSTTPPPNLTTALGAIFDLISWHASFPFPRTTDTVAIVDEPGLIRALALLSPRYPGSPVPRRLQPPSFDILTGNWGPHDGSIVTARHPGAEDWRRRTFRSLATPLTSTPSAASAATVYKLPVPRFFMYRPREQAAAGVGEADEQDEDDEGQQVAVVHDEDERTVDLRDALAATPPEVDPKTAKPFRESYDGILGRLPMQTPGLADLAVPKKVLWSLLSLLVPPEDNEPSLGLQACIRDLSSRNEEEEGVLNIEEYHALLEPHQVSQPGPNVVLLVYLTSSSAVADNHGLP